MTISYRSSSGCSHDRQTSEVFHDSNLEARNLSTRGANPASGFPIRAGFLRAEPPSLHTKAGGDPPSAENLKLKTIASHPFPPTSSERAILAQE